MNAVEQAAVVPGGRRSGSAGAATWVLTALFGIGTASLFYALSSGKTGPDFPLITVSFLYLMGITQAGVVFSAIMRLSGGDWAKPYYRLAELGTLAFFPFAILGLLLIYFYGRNDLFYWLSAGTDEHLSPWLDIRWLLVRNLFGLLLFYGLSAWYALKALRPDLAGRASPDQRVVESELRVLSPFVIVGFVVCNTFIAWDFGMMLNEHWHSTVFPIHFSFGNLFAGTAALILFPAVFGRSHFGQAQVRNLGMLVTGFTLMWLYFYWAQFFVIWFGNVPREMNPLWRQMYGHYAPYYWTMMAGCFFVPFVAFIFAAIKRSLAAMCVIALGINLGIWLNKYLTVATVFSPDDRPFDNWLDIGLSLTLLAGFLAVFAAVINRLPRYSYWEMNLQAGHHT
jgi:formate-dependent nitrite reductase membrane component NrfD